MAVLALPALVNAFGVPGGGYTLSNSAAFGIDAERWRREPETTTRIVNMNRLGEVLTGTTSPPVKVLFVYNNNALVTSPDQNRIQKGLEREDLFTVVFDQVRTDTARYADVILPATTFLEHYDIARGYGNYALQLVKPVIEPVGESRPNVVVFGELAARLGVGIEEDETDTLLRVAAGLPESIAPGVMEQRAVAPPSGARPVQMVDVLPRTPDEKIHLYPESLAKGRSALPLRGRSGVADLSARAHLAGEREDHQFDVRPVAAQRRPAADPSRGRRIARHHRGRHGAGLQRPRGRALPGARHLGHRSRCPQPAQGPVAPEHAQWRNRECPGASHARAPLRRRLLQ